MTVPCLVVVLTLLILTACHGFQLLSSKLQLGRARHMQLYLSSDLIVGVNKYSHDASCCIIDSGTGDILFTQAKERVTGRKHDGGSVGSIVQYGLQSIGAELKDVKTVVSNNHHFRVKPFEHRLSLNKALKYVPEVYDDVYNLMPDAQHYELSHHLAHAWSVAGTAPFRKGIIVVMDGMGESYKAMMEDVTGAETQSGDYMHDLKLVRSYTSMGAAFIGQPVSLLPGSTYREAESAYVFDCESAMMRPVFKRWTRECSPPELYNHGFENMESLGAVYSRVSSHILGDWNACGKVMGLAPWAGRGQTDAEGWYFQDGSSSSDVALDKVDLGKNFYHKYDLMAGSPLLEVGAGGLEINWEVLDGLPDPNNFSASRFGELANIAQSVQQDLDASALSLCTMLREATGESHLALAGGVALNSVMNGKLKVEAGYDRMYVPSAPGDEGIALGCAMYGLQRVRELAAFEANQQQQQQQQQKVGSDGATNIPGGGGEAAEQQKGEEEDSLMNFPRSRVDQLLNMDPNADAFDPVNGIRTNIVSPSEGKGEEEEQPQQQEEEEEEEEEESTSTPAATASAASTVPIQQTAFSVYQGREFKEDEVEGALYDMDPWITVDKFDNKEDLITDAALKIAEGDVIAWFQGRSEFGQRALGARSILADPRVSDMRRYINQYVKQREWYRPLAPSVLDEYAGDWFKELKSGENASPYMSITATVLMDRTADVPAICHVDDTARLQTVTSTDSPLYHALIEAYRKLTGIPMLLNTSFNRKGQPIVESPLQAIQTLMSCDGHINYLYLGLNRISIKPMPFDGAEDMLGIAKLARENNAEDSPSGEEEAVVKGPTTRESEVIVRGSPLYLCEVTTSTTANTGGGGGSNTPIRIRVQDGAVSDDLGADSGEGGEQWRTLPGELHLQILQLLLVISDDEMVSGLIQEAGLSSDEYTQESDICVGELYEALRSMNNDDEDGDDDSNVGTTTSGADSITWNELKEALQWLYMNNLISFEDPLAEQAAEELFDGVDVVDLRSLTN